jgi:hypothetical protein
MSKKWPNVPDEKRKRIFAYNKARAEDAEKAIDLMTLLSVLPPGQVKQLLKDKTCSAILSKYGITGS